ncbi:MAG TPA: ATP-binding protein [Stenomitos sp.]
MTERSTATLTDSLEQLQGLGAPLLVYRDILTRRPCQAWCALMTVAAQGDGPASEMVAAYSEWFYAVCETGYAWPTWIEAQILKADNPLSRQAQHQDIAHLPSGLLQAATIDLHLLQHWALDAPALIQGAIAARTGQLMPLPDSGANEVSSTALLHTTQHWSDALPDLVARYNRMGVGLFAEYKALRWREGQLEGIAHPDAIGLADLVGYDWQQAALRRNTEALLAGHVALNVLLYGSRGSGKSAHIKALLTEYGDRGLRLIELTKADMVHLSDVIEPLRASALKFIVFIDDLSFEEEEDSYKALKVLLEGTVTARPQNVVVYATSNRRHLIREFFGDRPRPSNAEEVHAWDTVQEKLSLSDRFGLTLTFEPADQDRYLLIVRHLAAQAGIDLPEDTLTYEALQWAVRQNTRSGRTARQFVDYIKGQHHQGATQ